GADFAIEVEQPVDAHPVDLARWGKGRRRDGEHAAGFIGEGHGRLRDNRSGGFGDSALPAHSSPLAVRNKISIVVSSNDRFPVLWTRASSRVSSPWRTTAPWPRP